MQKKKLKADPLDHSGIRSVLSIVMKNKFSFPIKKMEGKEFMNAVGFEPTRLLIGMLD